DHANVRTQRRGLGKMAARHFPRAQPRSGLTADDPTSDDVAVRKHVLFQLPERVVDVWETGLDLAADELQSLEGLLSPAARGPASRFTFERDRQRFTAGRGRLRQLLGRYTNAPPGAVVIETRASGKPFAPGQQPLEFNIAHSDNRAVFAFARRPVGV